MKLASFGLLSLCIAGSAVSAQTLYSNGPFATGPSTLSGVLAPAGFQWSEVANDLPTEANTSAGFAGYSQGTTNFRLADDFVIPSGQSWDVTSFLTYGYQTGSVAGTQPFGGGTFNIWNGRPGDVGSSIIGTAGFTSSVNTNVYRIFNTVAPPPGSAPGTTRLVREVSWSVTGGSITLGPGTYWIDFQYTHATGTASFVPSVTIPGTRFVPGWNARQFNGTIWTDVIDTGNPAAAPDYAQDVPFVVVGVPAPGSLALLGLGGLVAARRRRS